MMKIGIEQGAYISRYGLSEGLRRMKAHGYECLDYQDFCHTETELFAGSEADFERKLLDIKAQVEDAGIEISQTHGPWRWPPQDYTEEQRAERFEKMAKSVRGTAILGCRNMVIHPIMPYGDNQDPEPEKMWAMNYEFMGRLAEVGKEYNVVVNYENMPMPALTIAPPAAILRFVKNINSPYFKVCLDTGHCTMCGASPAEAVRQIGKEYLATLHVHDNDGRGDLHWLPTTGVIDWEDFASALQEIGFEGTLSLETGVLDDLPADELEAKEQWLFRQAAKLAGREQ